MSSMMTAKSLETLMDRSRAVAGWSNANTERHGLHWYEITLYRHRDGRYFLRNFGGGAMAVSRDVKWISEDDARAFIRDHAEGIDGYGFTETEIDELMTGGDPRGTRDDPRPFRPRFSEL